MPFLKCIRISTNKEQSEKSKKEGLRCSIFLPQRKGILKAHYKGEWKDNKKHGKGTDIDRNGRMYEGNWFCGQKHGYGVLSKIYKNSSIRKIYAGYWMIGKKEGFGNFWYENGDYYEGDFHCDKRHGYGRIWYQNGDYYQGFWRNDLSYGKGMFIKGDGNRYEGSFIDGKRNGLGTFYHLDSGQCQYGYWCNDFCINSIMQDINWRQSALHPTAYPIPETNISTICY
ncbi:PREDICTED: MORN repeat-containing protein 3-like [Polistes canadensis]|uniref:MORN repeat-containing protein 3-like n=1 Tax=Polistes canadensis TaxID=91411 RepID=UPI000718C030|nr:PREDICTED: MORN repeat-containing protein 3-like [Polistes canadensis]